MLLDICILKVLDIDRHFTHPSKKWGELLFVIGGGILVTHVTVPFGGNILDVEGGEVDGTVGGKRKR